MSICNAVVAELHLFLDFVQRLLWQQECKPEEKANLHLVNVTTVRWIQNAKEKSF